MFTVEHQQKQPLICVPDWTLSDPFWQDADASLLSQWQCSFPMKAALPLAQKAFISIMWH